MIASWGWNLGYFDFHDLIFSATSSRRDLSGKVEGEKRTVGKILE